MKFLNIYLLISQVFHCLDITNHWQTLPCLNLSVPFKYCVYFLLQDLIVYNWNLSVSILEEKQAPKSEGKFRKRIWMLSVHKSAFKNPPFQLHELHLAKFNIFCFQMIKVTLMNSGNTFLTSINILLWNIMNCKNNVSYI